MFELLDASLQNLLDDPAVGIPFPELLNADISFITPEKGYAPGQETLNLFLYETRENRELRDLTPIFDQINGVSVKRRPYLRVDCSYMVTAWSKKSGADKNSAE